MSNKTLFFIFALSLNFISASKGGISRKQKIARGVINPQPLEFQMDSSELQTAQKTLDSKF